MSGFCRLSVYFRRSIGALLLCSAPLLVAAERFSYLLPASAESVALAPFMIAREQGMYARRGLDVEFRTVAGGMNVGAALARGEGDLGGASGDTPILLRERGSAVKGVALLGGHAFLTLISNRHSRLDVDRLAGKTLAVPSFEDISYYALQSKVAAGAEVRISAMPPTRLWQALGSGEVDAIVGTVDWGVRAERTGVVLDWLGIDRFYPAMAQAILASDAAIAAKPRQIRQFIQATLDAMALMERDPAQAAAAYRRAVPTTDFSQPELARIFSLLAQHVYAGQAVGGAFDAATVAAMQERYLQKGLVTSRRAPAAFFTNSFVE